MVRLLGAVVARDRSTKWMEVAIGVLIMLVVTLMTRAQNAATNTNRSDELAGNSTSESTRNLKSVDRPVGPADYTFMVAVGVVCDSSEGAGCPAVVKSTNGDGYRLSGAGTFSAHGRSAAGAGTFTHESSLGVVLESGVWVVDQLISFDSYGLGTSLILKDQKVLGQARVGRRLTPGPMQVVAAGGRAVIRVRMLPITGPSRTATLEINCPVGQPPAEHQVDDIKLAMDGDGLQFEEQGPLHSLFVVGPTVISK